MKGQIWSADFLLSAVIFFVALAILVFTWNTTTEQISDQTVVADIENTGLFISDSLIRTSGLPADWNSTNVRVIGLVSEENVLDNTKLNRFINLSYATSKDLLGTGGHEFYFSLNHINGTPVQNEYGQNITAGIYPFQNATLVIPVERYVLYNREIKKLSFALWTI
jgi:hypothetical protein